MQETLNIKLNMQFNDTPSNHGDISMADSVLMKTGEKRLCTRRERDRVSVSGYAGSR